MSGFFLLARMQRERGASVWKSAYIVQRTYLLISIMARRFSRKSEESVMEEDLQGKEQSYALSIPSRSLVIREPDSQVQNFPTESMIGTASLTVGNGSNLTVDLAVPVSIQQQRSTVTMLATATPSTSANARAATETTTSSNTISQEGSMLPPPPKPPRTSTSTGGRTRAPRRAVAEGSSILRNALMEPRRPNYVPVYYTYRFMENPRATLMTTSYGRQLAEAEERRRARESRPSSPNVPTPCWLCSLMCSSKSSERQHFRMQHIRVFEQKKPTCTMCRCASCRGKFDLFSKEQAFEGHYLDPEKLLPPEEIQVESLDLSINGKEKVSM